MNLCVSLCVCVEGVVRDICFYVCVGGVCVVSGAGVVLCVLL